MSGIMLKEISNITIKSENIQKKKRKKAIFVEMF